MTLNCKGKLIDISEPKVMGILNITPNSFYDGGKFNSDLSILKQVEKMLNDGATFIDIGGYSSKPKAEFVSGNVEEERVVPAVDLILKNFPDTILSVDTFRSSIAKKCIEHGAAIINDISAGNLDENMMKTVGQLQVPYIMMHMRGTPVTMPSMTTYENLIKEILFYFAQKINEARSFGINDLVVDPGFGFAKTLSQNYEILQKLDLFKILELPILAGISRKSMIYKVLNSSAQEALNGTTVLNTVALTKGASILRVHDVKEAVECIKLHTQLQV